MAISSERSCCICNSREGSQDYGIREGYPLARCRPCGLVYLKEYAAPSRDFIEAATEKGGPVSGPEFWSLPEYYRKHSGIFETFFAERRGRICSFRPGSGRWLDVGCGFGFWMRHLADNGIPCFGLDPSAPAVSYGRANFGLEAVHSDFENYSSDERHPVINLVDVLEHFQDPAKMLLKAADLLQRDGLLYVQVPNVLGLRIPYNHDLGLPYHLWQFTPSSLARLLKRCGFQPLRMWTGIQGVIGVYERGGPSTVTRMKWHLARTLRIGNRLQILARKGTHASP